MKLDISKYKAFFFDFDGVIVDSIHIKTEAFGELFRRYGNKIKRKVMDYHCNNGGVSRYEKFRYYYKHLLKKPINEGMLRQLDREYSGLVFSKVIGAAYIKGVEKFIKELNRRGKLCFVISATPQKEIRRIVKTRNLKYFFKDTVGSPKDKTSNLKWLLRKYRIDPADAVYFGDAKSDYEAARSEGVDFVGVVNSKSRELKDRHLDYIIQSFSIFNN